MFTKCLDVSHYQGAIRWSRVAAAGYKLVFIKATQGTRFVDPLFLKNKDGAQDAGLLVVPYHFISAEPADLQAGHFINITKLKIKSPCMLDWERLDGKMPPINVVEAFGDNTKTQTGRDPLVYHGLYELSSPKINAWPWFVPKWGSVPSTKWLFWQYTDREIVDGITNPADADKFAGTLEDLIDWHRFGHLPAGFAASSVLENIKHIQRVLGVVDDGIFGPESRARLNENLRSAGQQEF